MRSQAHPVALMAMVWVLLGHGATSLAQVLGWGALPLAGLVLASFVAFWIERRKPVPVSKRRSWAVWAFALAWTLGIVVARFFQPNSLANSLWGLLGVAAGAGSTGLVLVLRNIHLGVSGVLLAWSFWVLNSGTSRAMGAGQFTDRE